MTGKSEQDSIARGGSGQPVGETPAEGWVFMASSLTNMPQEHFELDRGDARLIGGRRMSHPATSGDAGLDPDVRAVLRSVGDLRAALANPVRAVPAGPISELHCSAGTTSTDVEPSSSILVRWIWPSGRK